TRSASSSASFACASLRNWISLVSRALSSAMSGGYPDLQQLTLEGVNAPLTAPSQPVHQALPHSARSYPGRVMYQFSRSMYRELAAVVVTDPRMGPAENRHCLLERCEAAVERLAADRHYFARPARTLFNDVRTLFPL